MEDNLTSTDPPIHQIILEKKYLFLHGCHNEADEQGGQGSYTTRYFGIEDAVGSSFLFY